MNTEAAALSSVSEHRRSLNRLITSCQGDRRAYRHVSYASLGQKDTLLAMSRRRAAFIEEPSLRRMECALTEAHVVGAYDRAVARTTWAKDTGRAVRAQLDEVRLDYATRSAWRSAL